MGETILVAAGTRLRSNSPFAMRAKLAGSEGFSQSSLIITDLLTSSRLPKETPVRIFRLIADESIDELQSLVASLA